MSGAQSISTRRAYGVQRVCRVWHRARSSVYARRQATRSPALCRRRGPIGAAPDDPGGPIRLLEASPHGEGWPGRSCGSRGCTSKERVRLTTSKPRRARATRMGRRRTTGPSPPRRPRDVGHRHDGHREAITARPHASGSCRQARDPLEPIRQGIRERFAATTTWPVDCGCVTTTGRTTWPTIFNRRSRSSASKAPRASCGSPKATASRSASSAR